MSSPPPLALQRQPASAAFVARRLAVLAWQGAPSARVRLVERCRIELEWAVAEWRCLAGDPEVLPSGSHPAEACRLPHERAAARVVNCHLHLDVALWRLRELGPRLRRQRAAPLDDTQPGAARLYWADAAAATACDLRGHLARRRLAWRCYLAAAHDYVQLKSLIDRRNSAAAA